MQSLLASLPLPTQAEHLLEPVTHVEQGELHGIGAGVGSGVGVGVGSGVETGVSLQSFWTGLYSSYLSAQDLQLVLTSLPKPTQAEHVLVPVTHVEQGALHLESQLVYLGLNSWYEGKHAVQVSAEAGSLPVA